MPEVSKEEKEFIEFMKGWKKPKWGDYFMAIALLASTRSPDESQKNGCVVIDPKTNRVLSIGYNGYPAGSNDKIMPKTRPDKYMVFAHAEENAITTAARHGIRLDGALFYVTGKPCISCLRKIIQAGATGIVYGHFHSRVIDKKEEEMQGLLLNGRKNFFYQKIRGNEFTKLFDFSKDYYNKKISSMKRK